MGDHTGKRRWTFVALCVVCLSLGLLGLGAEARRTAHSPKGQASIDVDAAQVTGKVSPDIFGQNVEYEHGVISGGEQNMHHEHGLHSGGLWAEMLRDRKFEEGIWIRTAWPTAGSRRSASGTCPCEKLCLAT